MHLIATHFVFAGNIHLVAEELGQVHDRHGSRTTEESHTVLLYRNEKESNDFCRREGGRERKRGSSWAVEAGRKIRTEAAVMCQKARKMFGNRGGLQEAS